MKKLLLVIAMVAIGYSAVAQSILSRTITSGGSLYLLTTNRAKVYSIEVSTTNAYTFQFFDNDNTNNVPTNALAGFWGTNFVNGSYVSKSFYTTNVASSYVGANNFTNWYTNSGLYALTTTNAAATNAVPPLATVTTSGTSGETRVSYINAIFTRGIVFYCTGNGAVTVYYTPE